MKKVLLSLLFLTVSIFSAYCQRNVIIELIRFSVQDSVILTISDVEKNHPKTNKNVLLTLNEGGKIEHVESMKVFLVSDEQSFEGVTDVSVIIGDKDGKIVSTMTATTTNFNTPNDFTPKKIKIDIVIRNDRRTGGGARNKVAYYDIAKKIWDY